MLIPPMQSEDKAEPTLKYLQTHVHVHVTNGLHAFKAPEIACPHLYQMYTAFQLTNINEWQDRLHLPCSFLP